MSSFASTFAVKGSPRGLPWTVLRLHRAALIVWASCVVAAVGALVWQVENGAVAQEDVTSWYAVYHPQSHFWPLHLMETGIVLAVAAAAFLVLRRRTP